ncbi:hypothetical protein R75465_03992 [Paraburkholderia aspalathi]|nr:hypothetical protein R75465_03992 [Paraburkholderia aspalathi]
MVLFLQYQQRGRLSQGFLLTVQFALKLHIGLLQFTHFLGILIAATAPADGAEVHAPLFEMVSKQTPFTTPRIQRVFGQPVTLMQSQQPFLQRPVCRTFGMSGAGTPTRSGGASHPLP